MDVKLKAKSKVLDKLIEMMDDKMVGDLKGKSPKFAKVQIQSDDPKLANELKDKLIDGIKEDKDEEAERSCGDDMEDDDLERLKEMYDKIN